MEEAESNFAHFIEEWLHNSMGVDHEMTQFFKMIILVGLTLIVAVIFWWIGQFFINRVIDRMVKRTSTDWDDVLHEKGAFRKLGHIIPVIVISSVLPVAFSDYPDWIPVMRKVLDALVALVIIRLIVAVISAANTILSVSDKYKDKPVASFTQLAKLLVWFIGGIIMISIVLGRNPIFLFSALGAVSAVLLLIFKDTILGFIASAQLAVNDMIRLGDWVSVTKYGADGNVIEINLTTVKVRNWDYTISTVPTYSFVTDSFKNWRGMEEGEGRRIKRAFYIKVSSIKFCTPEMLEKMSAISLATAHISNKEMEIQADNTARAIDTSLDVNGRKQTNLGIFRAYLLNYIKQNEHINQDMTCMVRQLDPTPNGVPIEIYCFSRVKAWVAYESIQGDIFDHVYAAVKYFDLEVFESPTGSDFKKLANG